MSYTVTRTHRCITISGAIPLSDISALIDTWSRRDPEDGPALPDDVWYCDSLLAERLGVNLVCGTLRDTRAWRAELGIGEKID